MWLKLAPWLICAVLTGTLTIANARLDTARAELSQKDAECNTRVMEGAAAASDAARIASQAAIDAERSRWAGLLAKSEQAGREARDAREAAAAQAADLEERINAIYSKDQDAYHWSTTTLPAGVLAGLQTPGDL